MRSGNERKPLLSLSPRQMGTLLTRASRPSPANARTDPPDSRPYCQRTLRVQGGGEESARRAWPHRGVSHGRALALGPRSLLALDDKDDDDDGRNQTYNKVAVMVVRVQNWMILRGMVRYMRLSLSRQKTKEKRIEEKQMKKNRFRALAAPRLPSRAASQPQQPTRPRAPRRLRLAGRLARRGRVERAARRARP